MDRVELSRLVLNVDALGCLSAGAAVSSAPSVYRFVDSSGVSRPFVAGALTVTSFWLRAQARRPTPAGLGRSARVNLLWTLACLLTLPKQRTEVGRSLVAATAGLDAAMAGLQWYLRRSLPEEGA